MKIISNQKELKYIILNNIMYLVQNIILFEIDREDVLIYYKKDVKSSIQEIYGKINTLQYIFEK